MRRIGGVARITVVVSAVLAATAAPAFGAGTWKIQPTPNPFGATYSELNGVSCSSASACTAVGTSNRAGGENRTLAERWNGTKWAVQSSPNPKGSTSVVLNGVSCVSGSSCTAVGHHVKSNGLDVTRAERWNGTKWSIVSTPNPAQAVSTLNGVSCVSGKWCMAVGGAGPLVVNPIMTLIERWNGTKWSIVPSPNPVDAMQVSLTGVACSSSSACIAVGYMVTNNVERVVAERWNGTKWKLQSPVVPVSGKHSAFGGVSCTSATACTAVGFYVNGSNIGVSLVERWNGTKWKVQSTPNPQGAMITILLAVSCTSATACAATGRFQGNGGQFSVSERWNGTAWTLETPAEPPGTTRSSLDGVSCSNATVCEAVGFYEVPSGDGFTLAEVSS